MFVTVKATKSEIRKVLQNADYNKFYDVYNDKTGTVKKKFIEQDLDYVFNCIAQANHKHQPFSIRLEVGVVISNMMTVPGVVAITNANIITFNLFK